MVGSPVQLDTLMAIALDWVPVALVTAATLIISLAAGQLMALRRGITPVTGGLGAVLACTTTSVLAVQVLRPAMLLSAPLVARVLQRGAPVSAPRGGSPRA